MRFKQEKLPQMTELAAKVLLNAKKIEGQELTEEQCAMIRGTVGNLKDLSGTLGISIRYAKGIRNGEFRNRGNK